ncbi:helix-turn-helix domain-containing protein [Streptomyces sp. NBC_00059]|uniref:helix-turn-helix domain-containing protein n=1 Tax=Streptomyces sp. NBC_00059 TaxID=2975635 RepID=UPI00224CC1DC|nr:helix-turn-helix domain-containing protein [Streptomyces sp. NBC_00059]MCX5415006.1 hypothetical protein [Streptomyces sp. NBC_00059]MCX5416355.1 hypothetical protein [Streptomyces sp. NBC_00059]
MSTAKDVGPEAAVYAAALRAAVNGFTAHGGTQREIAAAAHVAPATLSRYLSGERTAPSGFVAALDDFLTQSGWPLVAGMRAQLDELCALAHQASGSPAVQLAHLKEELERVRAEKQAGTAELAALREHADQLAASLHKAVEQARQAEQGRLALEERVTGQDNNLQHAQTYTQQLQDELTALHQQVVLIQQEVKVLRRQNKRLLEEHTAAPSSGSREKTTVSGASTQATGTKKKGSPSPGGTAGGGKKEKGRQAPNPPQPAHGHREQTPKARAQDTRARKTPVFTTSWTGNEDPKSYSENKRQIQAGVMALGGSVLLIGGLNHEAQFSANLLYILGGVFLAVAVALGDDMFPQKRMRSAMQARTLRLDHTGVTISDPSGEQHLHWAAIKKVSVHPTTKIYERVPLALHVQLRNTATAEAALLYRPAGWPLGSKPPEVCNRPVRTWDDEWVPLCVLGPLAGPDKTSLQNTLNAYLKKPLEGSW